MLVFNTMNYMQGPAMRTQTPCFVHTMHALLFFYGG